MEVFYKNTLRKKCPYLEFFWSAFSRIQTKYGEIRSIRSDSRRLVAVKHLKNSITDVWMDLKHVF